MVHSFSVPFQYPVGYVDDVLRDGARMLFDLIESSGTPRAIMFVDSGVDAADARLLPRIQIQLGHRLVAPPLVVPGGEAGKNGLAEVERCARFLDENKIDRHAYVIAIGGGAMLDVVGFAAAITHRGVRLIRMPTTVLAQNDAGIGVKNGVNCFGKKNFLGSFAPPFAVINDFSLLRTLRPEQWRDGTAEAVKVALIRDRPFFDWIEANTALLVERDASAFKYLIRRCAELHLEHITTSGDPFERGSARPLDFGHWSAHKMESLSGFRLSHGHAVAVGMAIDMTYAVRMNICDTSVAEQVIQCLRALRFPLAVGDEFTSHGDVEPVLAGMREFQEHLGGALSLAMVTAPGERVEVDRVDLDVMRQCVQSVLFDRK